MPDPFAVDIRVILLHLENRFSGGREDSVAAHAQQRRFTREDKVPSSLAEKRTRTYRGGRLPSSSVDTSEPRPLSGQLVVFTGKLSSLGRKEAHQLVVRLGGRTADDVNAKTTMLVVGAEGFGSAGETSGKLRRAEELNGQAAACIQIVTEDAFCEIAGIPTSDALKQRYHAMRDLLVRYPMLREDQFRYLVKCGAISPVFRTNADVFVAFADLAAIKQAHDEMSKGAGFPAVVRSLLASRHGQLAFDFRSDAVPAKILTLERRTPPRSRRPEIPASRPQDTAQAEEYFRTGSALDTGEESTRDQAAAAYRKALEFDPGLVAALINLANIHYSRDEMAEAQALYERAIGLEPDFFEAHFNLGNIHHDLGRFAEARLCYQEALRLNPTYADAHFYMAVVLEKMGFSAEARPYWRGYRQLAPQGEWVQLAKEFSE
jgi:tetratricopeptide (TPR) repeat protein